MEASIAVKKPDSRQYSYARQFEQMVHTHALLAENGLSFAHSLHQMHDDLMEMAANMERGRKHWKTYGINSEKQVKDSEALMEKAKAKYDSLADEYERIKNPDPHRRGKPAFSLRGGVKHGAALEEDLQRKVQAADAEYVNRVNAANVHRNELMQQLRPQAVRALKDMIFECDAGLTFHLQKFGK